MEVVGHVPPVKHQRVDRQPNAAVLAAPSVAILHALTVFPTSSLIIAVAKPVLLPLIRTVGTLLSA